MICSHLFHVLFQLIVPKAGISVVWSVHHVLQGPIRIRLIRARVSCAQKDLQHLTKSMDPLVSKIVKVCGFVIYNNQILRTILRKKKVFFFFRFVFKFKTFSPANRMNVMYNHLAEIKYFR